MSAGDGAGAGEPVLDDRILGMLAEVVIVRLATVTPAGRPHAAPFWFWTDGWRFVIATLDNQTVRNLRANPDVSVLVDVGTDFRDLRGALIRGRATLWTEDDEVPEVVRTGLAAIDEVHRDELEEPEFARYAEWERRMPVYLEIEPEQATWFDLGRAESGRTGPA